MLITETHKDVPTQAGGDMSACCPEDVTFDGAHY